MNNMQQTSLDAYEDIKLTLGERQIAVYSILLNIAPANNTMIADKLNWSINRVTPRVLELRKIGLICEDSKRICPITKRNTIFWKINKIIKIK